MTTVRLNKIRRLLWIYFWLLLFEGALRKWVLPGLSNPLLLVREPVALWALYMSWPILQKRQWQQWVQPLFIIGFFGFFLAITVGHGDLFTAIYGLRVFVLQLPLMFVFASVFRREDLIRLAWIVLWLSIPMTVLIALQSGQPDTHILNVGAGGIGSASFDGALGRSRPSGTFSFITGVAAFYTLAASSLLMLLYNTRISLYARNVCVLSGISLVVALPVSISRTLLAGYAMVLVATVASLILSRVKLLSLFTGLFALAAAVSIATFIPAFQDTSEAFLSRWETAAASSGDVRAEIGDAGIVSGQIQGRVLPGLLKPFSNFDNIPILGYGIGMGSNVGAQRLGGEGAGFLLGEDGWEVSVNELGLLLGFYFLLWRVALTIWILRLSIQAAIRGNQAPLMLAGSSLYIVLQGQLSQPTGLGFIVLMGGLTLAACNSNFTTTAMIKSPNIDIDVSNFQYTR